MRWQTEYLRVAAYVEQRGVLPDLKLKEPLALWLKSQMRDWTKLSDGQLKLLWELGVKFGWREQCFIPRYLQLVEFRQKYGHCRVTDSYDKKLAKWVRRMRQDKARFPPSWIQQLDRLGFIWDVLEEGWQRHVEEFKAFVKENGHGHVPKGYKKYPTLFSWVNNIRSGNNRTSCQRREELLAIGFDFEPWSRGQHHVDQAFQFHVQNIKAFKAKCGHADVPSRTKIKEFTALVSWIQAIRQGRGKLSASQKQKLVELGVDLRPRSGRIQRASGGRNYAKYLETLKAFVAEYGHGRVSTRNPRYKSLANWLSNLRRGLYCLEAKERAELEALGVNLELQVQRKKKKQSRKSGKRRKLVT